MTLRFTLSFDNFDQINEAADKYKMELCNRDCRPTNFRFLDHLFKNVQHEKVINFLNKPNVLFFSSDIWNCIVDSDTNGKYQWLLDHLMQRYIDNSFLGGASWLGKTPRPFFGDFDNDDDLESRSPEFDIDLLLWDELRPIEKTFIVLILNQGLYTSFKTVGDYMVWLYEQQDVKSTVLYSIMECLDEKWLSSLPYILKINNFIKTFVHNQIIRKAMALKGQFPTLVLANILSYSIYNIFNENQIIGFIRPINESRKNTAQEKLALLSEESAEAMKLRIKIFERVDMEKFQVYLKTAKQKTTDTKKFYVDISNQEYRTILKIKENRYTYLWFDDFCISKNKFNLSL